MRAFRRICPDLDAPATILFHQKSRTVSIFPSKSFFINSASASASASAVVSSSLALNAACSLLPFCLNAYGFSYRAHFNAFAAACYFSCRISARNSTSFSMRLCDSMINPMSCANWSSEMATPVCSVPLSDANGARNDENIR